ncbi:helix-turn-helix domain-containing protein [Gordonia otitidis]|uniref:AraC family transcriptional regulator n=1 Tax=Gordonia otitidis (strain DSM 44809 / CCUG 52243 / JCM 12355 / NBRC 100426 / IFM 10032) TaxID=1108044 RepID=H5TGE5_GORO1|nr:helix-turn-helix domain-containing protein [Gordonia otitidis]GAB32553.1 putative AraC family transcriptional regulator [Gordonia otitidis NBRC 100426]
MPARGAHHTGGPDTRGVLYPARLPTFDRLAAADDLAPIVAWFWIPQWNLAPGRTSRQNVLPFPACNLVVEPEGVTIVGPTTRCSHRDLTGTGWAVGALLRPAGAAALDISPRELRDDALQYHATELFDSISAAMSVGSPEIAEAASRFSSWLRERTTRAPDSALLANEMVDLIAGDRSIIRVDDLARRLSMSVRSVQRVADRYIGLSPLAVIRRYRLQEAAERLRADPEITLAEVAADLAYTDQAHFSADFRHTLGLPPGEYRRSVEKAVDS